MALGDRPFNAKDKRAFNDGAQSKRGGLQITRVMQFFLPHETSLIDCWKRGWRLQHNAPRETVVYDNYSFLLTCDQPKPVTAIEKPAPRKKEITMKTRTAKQLADLKAAYRAVYDPYAAEQTAAGNTPQPFDEAFSAHLAALDEEEAKNPTPAPEKPVKAAKAPKAPKEPKPAAAPKAKKFRPTSEDRATLMAAAAKLLKDGGTPRMKLANGDPYVNFLKGTDTDANGNVEVMLDVFNAKDTATKVGALKVTVKKGALNKVTKA